jgi:hypothetical protein
MHLIGKDGQDIHGSLYGKVVGTVPGSKARFSVRFTSVSPEIETFLRAQGTTVEKVPLSAPVVS